MMSIIDNIPRETTIIMISMELFDFINVFVSGVKLEVVLIAFVSASVVAESPLILHIITITIVSYASFTF